MSDAPSKFACQEIRPGLGKAKCDQKANRNGSGREPEFRLGEKRQDGPFDANHCPDEHNNEQ